MLTWDVIVSDVLNCEVDGLLCTANPWLNMSGGVNGAILARGNRHIQDELYAFLATQPKKYVPPATVVETSPGNLPVRVLLHAVAIDAFYGSSPAQVTRTLDNALTLAAQRGCRSIAMPTLATGYGPLSMEQFAEGLKPILSRAYPPVESLTVAVLKESDRARIHATLT